MENTNIYKDIARRTNGDIYIGVVGPVRSGKSTFIKRFMETLVIPAIENQYRKERAIDELPQSAAGRTIMTTEPKFIPEEAVKVKLENSTSMNVRMIDCVGYIVPSSIGYIENEMPRMVMTSWFEDEIPFNMAAEIGTKKVITEHSTIGLVITTDGSISDISRGEYEEAEERVINELKEIDKPFIILLNSANEHAPETAELRQKMEQKYRVPVVVVNCTQLSEENIKEILAKVLYQFPINQIAVNIPPWILSLDQEHWLRKEVLQWVYDSAKDVKHVSEVGHCMDCLKSCEHVVRSGVNEVLLGNGFADTFLEVNPSLFYKILGEQTGLEIQDEGELMRQIAMLSKMKREYDKIKDAIDEVHATGYGIVMPSMEELTLDEPEILKQGGKYGVKLKASAPSIHMMKANITTQVSPIVGSEKQSEELVSYLLQEFEENPKKIWESNIFGKSLHELVNEGLHNKLYRMPPDARLKLQETIERIINNGANGLICIIL